VYYGTSSRIDIVKYNSYYYVAKTTAGNGFAGVTPTNTAYWEPFGAQFESVATKLLLAEYANIGGLIFRNNRLESADGSFYIDGNNNKIVIGKGVFRGSIATPFINYVGTSGETLTLTENFNYSMRAPTSGGTFTVNLPAGAQYNGVICRIFNAGISQNEGPITVNGSNGILATIPKGKIGIFQCLYFQSLNTYPWGCLNSKELA
jgi:hypothetical protein